MHAQHAMAVHLTEGVDVGAGGLEDAQSEESEHGDEGEVVGGGESRPAVIMASNSAAGGNAAIDFCR